MNYTISISTEEDAEEITNLSKQSGGLHQEKEPNYFKKCSFDDKFEHIKRTIKNENSEIFKAFDKEKIVGYLVLLIQNCSEEFFVYSNFGYISALCVDESCRKQGVAQALISEAEKYLLSKNINSMELDVFLFNEQANNLYEKMGYKNLKFRKRKLL